MTLDKERLRVLASDFRSHPLSQHIAEVEEAGEGLCALLSENAAKDKQLAAYAILTKSLEERQHLASNEHAKAIEARDTLQSERDANAILTAENAALAADNDRLRKDAGRYCAFFTAGLPITFLGLDYYNKPSLDAAIDAIRADKGEAT